MSARQIGQPVAISTTLSTYAEHKRTWPHGTSAIPVLGPVRHTSQQSTAATSAGDVELCAAGDDVVACWLSMRRHADAVRPCARRRCDSITARRNWSRMYELASKRATHAFNRVSFMMFLFFLGRWRGCSSLH